MSFDTLGLSAPLLKAVAKQGYTTPSPIQVKAIPLILERKDVLASAQTGTGKTAGFTLPLLQILSEAEHKRNRPIRALVLAPTRELAAQVYQNVLSYSAFLDIRATVIFGGVNQNPQVATLKNGVDILVATPGRLLDLHGQRALSLANVEVLILDEADRMLDMGFLKDIKRILELLPSKRQNLLFSATFSKEIKQLANGFLHHPVLVEATPENTTAEMVVQKMYLVDKSKKKDVIIKLISEGNWDQVLVFTRTKHGANRLSEQMTKAGVAAVAIHGNKSQGARTKALDDFKKGRVRVLVATDIAARGLDIPLLPHVINYEMPNVAEDYVHRIGRTGRAGASGEAISLVSHDEITYVKGIEKLLGHTLPTKILAGFEPSGKAEKVSEHHQRPNARKPRPQVGGKGGYSKSGNRNSAPSGRTKR